jgi:hypothetical protein
MPSDFQYIRTYYQVPAEEGRCVTYTDAKGTRSGVIHSTTHQYINIWFDGDPKPRGPYHPTAGIAYLPETKPVPKRTPSQERYARFLSCRDLFDSFRDFLAYEKTEKAAAKCGFTSVSAYNAYLRTL